MISHFILLLSRYFLCLCLWTTWIWGVSVWISLCLPYLALVELVEIKVNVFQQIGTLSTIISANIFSLPFVSLLVSFLLHVCWYPLYPTGFWDSVHFFVSYFLFSVFFRLDDFYWFIFKFWLSLSLLTSEVFWPHSLSSWA